MIVEHSNLSLPVFLAFEVFWGGCADGERSTGPASPSSKTGLTPGAEPPVIQAVVGRGPAPADPNLWARLHRELRWRFVGAGRGAGVVGDGRRCRAWSAVTGRSAFHDTVTCCRVSAVAQFLLLRRPSVAPLATRSVVGSDEECDLVR